ncbi:MAG: FG-GAP repeat domain-containing protein, partial [Acidimicrobiia bacterium]
MAAVAPSQAALPFGFAPPVHYLFDADAAPNGNNPLDMAAGDLNGDSAIDLVTVNGNNSFTVFLNDGNGDFSDAETFASGAGTNPVALAVGDLNSDTFPDVATANN